MTSLKSSLEIKKMASVGRAHILLEVLMWHMISDLFSSSYCEWAQERSDPGSWTNTLQSCFETVITISRSYKRAAQCLWAKYVLSRDHREQLTRLWCGTLSWSRLTTWSDEKWPTPWAPWHFRLLRRECSRCLLPGRRRVWDPTCGSHTYICHIIQNTKKKAEVTSWHFSCFVRFV